MQIEICANSYASASNAEKAGADRIELCVELAVGGITPSFGLIKKVMEKISIPVHVLIRPRSGDFTYNDAEFDAMKTDIELCKKLGCHGIVSGVLHRDFSIDIKRTKELIACSKPLSFTFHRAFDWVPNPLQSLEQLLELDVDRILTSGQETSVIKGISLLKQLQVLAGNRLIIMPGGGVDKNTIIQCEKAAFKEVHFSATELCKTINYPKVPMNSNRFFDETQLAISDISKIKAVVSFVK